VGKVETVPCTTPCGIVKVTVRAVALVTVGIPAVTPPPAMTVVEPCAKWVFNPVNATVTVFPGFPELGDTDEMVGAVTESRSLNPARTRKIAIWARVTNWSGSTSQAWRAALPSRNPK